MPDYEILDGPLGGQSLAMGEDEPDVGCALTIEVVDVAEHPEDVARYEYRVVSRAGGLEPGSLRLARVDDVPGPAAA